MRRILKKYFIPHEENNYHPHILHTKRAVMYGAIGIVMKAIVVVFVFALPLDVFVMPDVLAGEEARIIELTNVVRAKHNLPALKNAAALVRSSANRASDMAEKEYFDHISPTSKNFRAFLTDAGYEYLSAGENLAMGFLDAESVVSAWEKSSSHYANLVDPEYKDTGVGLVSGYFDGVPTVYVAEHFGRPERLKGVVSEPTSLPIRKSASLPEPVEPTKATDAVPPLDKGGVGEVLGEVEIKTVPPEPIVYDKSNSTVSWEEVEGRLILQASADISGAVQWAEVKVGERTIGLLPDNGRYVGGAVINQTADQFFSVILSPTIEITGADGAVVRDIIRWNKIKIVSPTPMQKYTRAKQSAGFFGSVFSVSKIIYLALIVFFSISLLLMIIIEIKKQRPHIIAQTAGLIGLLVYLYVV